MRKGIDFILENFKKTFKTVNDHQELGYLYNRIKSEYDHISKAKKTGDLYIHFKKFRDNSHKYSKDFSIFTKFGIIPNEGIADYLENHFPDEINDYTKVEDFVIGEIYNNSDIRFGFGCTYMGGIRPSKRTNTIVIIANHVKSIYYDKWEDDVLFYTGEGQVGNQKMSGKNLSIQNAKYDNRTVHLFECFTEKEYTYRGQVFLCDIPFTEKQKDNKENYRNVIIFPLKLVSNNLKILPQKNELEQVQKGREKNISKLNDSKINEMAKQAREQPISRQTITKYIYRDPYVSEYVKRRASGFCELCGDPAPFITKDNKPYLEVHHVITLSENGPDTIVNAVALCPNCHRKVHYGTDDKDIELITKVIMNDLRKEPKLFKKAKDLFKIEENKLWR